jgi:hypothetical protein
MMRRTSGTQQQPELNNTHTERENGSPTPPVRSFARRSTKRKNKKERTGLDLTNDYNDNKAELKKRQQKNKRHTNHQIANETKNKKESAAIERIT